MPVLLGSNGGVMVCDGEVMLDDAGTQGCCEFTTSCHPADCFDFMHIPEITGQWFYFRGVLLAVGQYTLNMTKSWVFQNGIGYRWSFTTGDPQGTITMTTDAGWQANGWNGTHTVYNNLIGAVDSGDAKYLYMDSGGMGTFCTSGQCGFNSWLFLMSLRFGVDSTQLPGNWPGPCDCFSNCNDNHINCGHFQWVYRAFNPTFCDNFPPCIPNGLTWGFGGQGGGSTPWGFEHPAMSLVFNDTPSI